MSCSATAAPLLLGATVSEEYRYPDVTTTYGPTVYLPQSFVVGAGQESSVVLEGVTTFDIDFSDAALDIAFDTVLSNPTFGTAGFNGLVFTSDAFTQVSGVSVGSGTNLAGFDASRVSIVGNELRIDWNGLSYDSDTVVDLTFTGTVPEPASWALMITGFGAIGGATRRRNRMIRVRHA